MRRAWGERNRGRAGFTIVEVIAAGVVVSVAIVLLVLMGSRSRKLAQCGESMANLKTYAYGTSSYAADYQDLFWTFTWGPARVPSDADPDLRFPTDVIEGGANQSAQIIRRRGHDPSFPRVENRIVFPRWSHLVLGDYLGLDFPWHFTLSPSDKNRVLWATDVSGFRAGRYPLGPWGSGPPPPEWWLYAYSSSYDYGPVFFSVDSGSNAIQQYAEFEIYIASSASIAPRRVAEVSFPSQKAMVWDKYSYYFGRRQSYCLEPNARIPVLSVDGSASVRSTASANPGWQPRNPSSSFPSSFYHQTEAWETENGVLEPRILVRGHHRWTRGGLRGRDFDGPEVTQP